MVQLGTIGRATESTVRSARLGDLIWIAYTDADGQAAAIRLDLSGAVVDRLTVGGGALASIASVGDRGMMFLVDGTTIELDAAGLGTRTPHPGLDFEPLAYGFPGLGYLAGAVWLDLDGAILGRASISPLDVDTATADAALIAWTTYPPTPPVLGQHRSTLETVRVPFGAMDPDDPAVRVEELAVAAGVRIECSGELPD